MALSAPALIAFLQQRANATRSPLVQAVYTGLVDRIRRGDFDEKEEGR